MRCMFARAGGGRELSQDPGSKTPTKAEARVVRAPHPLPRVVHFLGTQWPPQRYGLEGGVDLCRRTGSHRCLPGSQKAGVNGVESIIR